VAAAASNDVWAVGVGGTNNATLIEHWNGANWSEVSSPTMPMGSDLKAVTAPASNNVWAIGNNSQSANALVEHWDGTRWSVVSSPAFAGVTFPGEGKSGILSADSTTDVWAVGGGGQRAIGGALQRLGVPALERADLEHHLRPQLQPVSHGALSN
jgi:hypothetical protein